MLRLWSLAALLTLGACAAPAPAAPGTAPSSAAPVVPPAPAAAATSGLGPNGGRRPCRGQAVDPHPPHDRLAQGIRRLPVGVPLASRSSTLAPDPATSCRASRPSSRAGNTSWDAYHGPTNNVIAILAPSGGLEDVRPFLVLPEVTADDAWAGGFEKWGHDLSHQPLLFFLRHGARAGRVAVNRDLVPFPGLATTDDLVDPRWKGKIALSDPRTPAQGSIFLTCAMEYKNRQGQDGEIWVRRLLAEQDRHRHRSAPDHRVGGARTLPRRHRRREVRAEGDAARRIGRNVEMHLARAPVAA